MKRSTSRGGSYCQRWQKIHQLIAASRVGASRYLAIGASLGRRADGRRSLGGVDSTFSQALVRADRCRRRHPARLPRVAPALARPDAGASGRSPRWASPLPGPVSARRHGTATHDIVSLNALSRVTPRQPAPEDQRRGAERGRRAARTYVDPRPGCGSPIPNGAARSHEGRAGIAHADLSLSHGSGIGLQQPHLAPLLPRRLRPTRTTTHRPRRSAQAT